MVCAALVAAWGASAAPITAEQAKRAMTTWVTARPAAHLETQLGAVATVDSVAGDDGNPLFHVVGLEGGGYVITSADDQIGPVIAFSDNGVLEQDERNPLWKMLTTDLPKRQAATAVWAKSAALNAASGSATASALSQTATAAATEWADLLSEAEEADEPSKPKAGPSYGLSTLSDVRVPILLPTKWNQAKVGSKNCYNYYTPNNWVCGCVATACAQLMRKHKYPTASVGQKTYTCWVQGTETSKTMMGGVYDWSNMPGEPTSSIAETQCKAIGKLCYDAGIISQMSWTSGESGACLPVTALGLVNAFGYRNAICNLNQGTFGSTAFQSAIYANLDAGYPVLLGITDANGKSGHAIVADGYGYSGSTAYTHLNLGWAGSQDAWYALPSIGTGYNFSVVDTIVYNVFPDKSGDLLTGRVTDASGRAVSGATVTVANSNNSVKQTVTTNEKGIYAAFVEGGKTWYVTAAKSGYETSGQKIVAVVKSVSNRLGEVYYGGCSYYLNGVIGNSWGNDFVLQNAASKPDLIVHKCFLSSSSAQNASSSAAETSYRDGQKIYGHVGYMNQGGSATANSFDVKHEVLDSSGRLVESRTYTYTQTAAMAAGAQLQWSPFDWSGLDELSEGTYTYRCTVNPDRTVTESDYSNNSASFTFKVEEEEVVLQSLAISGPDAIAAGSSATYTCRATLSDGGVRTVNPTWTISSGSAYASVDAQGNVKAVASTTSHTIILKASYSLNGITRTATKTVSITAAMTIPDAVNNHELTFRTGGDAPWFGQAEVSWDGQGAARSGAIGHNKSTWMETTVTGPGKLFYRYFVRSEARYDKFQFLCDGDVVLTDSGTDKEWNDHTFVLEDNHTVTFRWQYVKDGSGSEGADAVFVDRVTWEPMQNPVVLDSIVISGALSVDAGSSSTFTCRATMSNGTAKSVSPAWSIVSGGESATIGSSGVLSTKASAQSSWVRVKASYSEGGVTRTATADVSVRGVLPAPGKPVITLAGAGDAQAARIAWSAASNASSYQVYRDETQIANGLVSLDYADSSVKPGVHHSYRVVAWNTEGTTSSDSATAYRVVSLSASPSGLAFGADDEAVLPLAIKSNDADWTVSANESWIHVEKTGASSVSVAVDRNENEERRVGGVSLTAGGDTAEPKSITVIVSQEAAEQLPDLAFQLSGDQPDVTVCDSADEADTLFDVDDAVRLAFGWTNCGDGAAEGAVVNDVTVTPFLGGEALQVRLTEEGGVAVDANLRGSADFTELAPGPYVASILLDANGAVREKDENNNESIVRFAVRDEIEIAEAVNNDRLSFWTVNDEWFGTRGFGADGEHCAMTKHLGDGAENKLTTTVVGPGTLTFAYRVSSEPNDVFSVSVDNVQAFAESGLGDWTVTEIRVEGEGDHSISWTYAKDATLSAGADCAFLDQVLWVSDYSFDPPENVQATDGESGITVSWDPCEGATSYQIARAESEDGPWVEVGYEYASTEHNPVFYDSGVLGGVRYWYRVRSVFPGGESEWSEPDDGHRTASIDAVGCTVPGAEGRSFVDVLANCRWVAALAEPSDWLTLDPAASDGTGEGKVLFSYLANPDEKSERTAKIVLTAVTDDGLESAACEPVELEITQGRAIDYGRIVSLNEAGDCDLVFETHGDGVWVGQTRLNHDGKSALRSGQVSNYGRSVLQTTLDRAGTLTFWWGTHCESCDTLTFRIGDEVVETIGEDYQDSDRVTNWRQVSVRIPEGGAVVSWTYEKDVSYSAGEDAGFVDEIAWDPDAPMPEDVWWNRYGAELSRRLGIPLSERQRILKSRSPGSEGSAGKTTFVWEDYVAGTNPLDDDSAFRALISVDADGTPEISWDPRDSDLDATRRYQIFGREGLLSGDWEPADADKLDPYNFFKVSVEMR